MTRSIKIYSKEIIFIQIAFDGWKTVQDFWCSKGFFLLNKSRSSEFERQSQAGLLPNERNGTVWPDRYRANAALWKSSERQPTGTAGRQRSHRRQRSSWRRRWQSMRRGGAQVHARLATTFKRRVQPAQARKVMIGYKERTTLVHVTTVSESGHV